MARPRAYSQDQITTALQETKGMVTVAARRLGCAANTIRAYAVRYPDTVGRALKDERAMMGDIAELALFKAIQAGEMSAIIFYLKTQCKDRGYVERVEQHVEQHGRMVVEVVYGSSALGEDLPAPAALRAAENQG